MESIVPSGLARRTGDPCSWARSSGRSRHDFTSSAFNLCGSSLPQKGCSRDIPSIAPGKWDKTPGGRSAQFLLCPLKDLQSSVQASLGPATITMKILTYTVLLPSSRNAQTLMRPDVKSNDDIEPCLTAVMPVYNEVATVSGIVKVVLAQRPVKQLVIVDDCSQDGTWDQLQLLAGSRTVHQTSGNA